MDRPRSPRLPLLCLLSMLIHTSTASFKFTDIQLIVGFSSACTSAYDSTVKDCVLNDLQGIGGSGSCSSDCISSIQTAQSSVQRACSRETADGNSLIGKLFVGDGVVFLCGDDSAQSTTTTTTTVRGTTATSNTKTASQSSASSGAASTATTTADSTTSSSSTETASRSTELSSSTSETSSASLSSTSIETATSSITSFSSSTSSSSSSSTSSSTTASSGGSDTNAGGGGSPFDNIGNAGTLSKALRPHFLALSLVFTLLVLH